MKTIGKLAIAALLACGMIAPNSIRPAAADEPAADPAPADDSAAVVPPAAGAPADDEIEQLLQALSPEQIEELIKVAVDARLKVERQQVVAEIRQNMLYDPAEVNKAVAVLNQGAANTQKDNIDRICKAFAAADVLFAKAYKLYNGAKHAEAVAAVKKVLDPKQATYLSAAQHFLYAEALAKAGKNWDAIDAYSKLMADMPDRISFAASAASRSAELYEQMRRGYYAMEMYAYALTNYGLTLAKKEYDDIVKRLEELEKIYKDPLKTVAGMMGDVERRLAAIDSGKQTQQKEQEIVAILEDLIKTAEEKQCGGSQSQGQQSQRPCPKCGKKGCQGQCQGQGQGQGGKQGPPSGTQQPSSHARVSALVPGRVERPTKLGKERLSGEHGDWAKMPPRERDKLRDAARKLASERYRDLLHEYRSRLAKANRGASAGSGEE